MPTPPQPVIITAATTLKARALIGSEWSAVNEAFFYLTGTQAAATANLTISEIHYHPEGTGQGDAEFIEFTNTGATTVSLPGTGAEAGTMVRTPSASDA